jgi:hypothetical protein
MGLIIQLAKQPNGLITINVSIASLILSARSLGKFNIFLDS